MSTATVTEGVDPWCNDQRGECQRIAARAADAVLALLPGLVSNDAATRGTDV